MNVGKILSSISWKSPIRSKKISVRKQSLLVDKPNALDVIHNYSHIVWYKPFKMKK